VPTGDIRTILVVPKCVYRKSSSSSGNGLFHTVSTVRNVKRELFRVGFAERPVRARNNVIERHALGRARRVVGWPANTENGWLKKKKKKYIYVCVCERRTIDGYLLFVSTLTTAYCTEPTRRPRRDPKEIKRKQSGTETIREKARARKVISRRNVTARRDVCERWNPRDLRDADSSRADEDGFSGPPRGYPKETVVAWITRRPSG